MEKKSQEGWRFFLRLCTQLGNQEKFEAFFEFFLTHEEKEDLAKRVLIAKELISGQLTQRELAQKLGVSISKITRGSNALKIIDQDIKEILKEL